MSAPANKALQGTFPLLTHPQPFKDFETWLGACVRVLAGPIAPNANLAVQHTLRKLPNFTWLLDAGTTGATQPLPRGATAWDFAHVYVSVPNIPAGQALLLVIA